MKNAVRAVLAVTVVLSAVPAMAQFQKPEDAVKYRQSAFTVMAAHFGRIGAMVQGRVPFDAKMAQENAAVVETLSKLPFAGFGADTESVNSKAKPEIWKEKAKFDQGGDKLMAAATALNTAAKSGNLDAIKTAFGETAATCKACHDSYRAK
jgi:cytochrome c556